MLIRMIKRLFQSILILLCILIPTISISDTIKSVGVNPVSKKNGTDSLIISKNVFEPGEEISLTFTASSHYPDKSWIGMFNADLPHDGMAANNNLELAYHYLKKSPKGTFIYTAPTKEGAYDFRMFDRGSGKEVATLNFTVSVNTAAASLKLPKKVFEPGEDITLSFTASPDYPDQSWIGMFNADLPHDGMANNNNKELAYHYLKKSPEGTFTYTAPTEEGDYDFRMFERSNSKEVATINFTVNKNHTIQDKSVKNNSLTRLDTSGVDGIVDIKPAEDDTTIKLSEEMKKPSGTKTTSITKQQNKTNAKSVKKVTGKLLPSETQGIDNNQSSEILFDGVLGKQWKELAAYGGDFKKFAKIEDKVLLVDVPQGNSWGKTGIRSTEALFKIPEKDDKLSEKLTFTFDPVRSSDYILAIIPSNWDGNLEWRSHYIRVGLQRDEENKNSLLTLWIKGEEMMKVNLDPESIEQLSIVMRPDRLVLVTDGSNNILLQGFIPENRPIYKDGYKVSVLTHAPKKDMSAKLALINITREDINYTRTKKEDDPSLWLENRQKITVFDGRILDKRWIKYNAVGGDFSKHARLQEGRLLVDVPEDSKLGIVGIMSPEPIVWLDKFGEGAEVDVTYQFDPKKSTGFVAALGTQYSLNGNLPNQPNIYLHWHLKEGVGRADLYHNDKIIKSYKLSSHAPEEVTFALYPKRFSLKVKGIEEEIFPWSDLTIGQGLRVYAYTKADKRNMPVTMALKKIELERKAGKAIPPPSPAEGVAPLPSKVLFEGKLGNIWQESTIRNGQFSKQAQFEDNRLVINLPKKAYNGRRVGLLSKEPLFMLDERIQTTTYTVSIHVDPRETTGFQIMFSPGKHGNMWRSMDAAISLVCYTEGAMAGQCMLGLRRSASPYALWERLIEKAWLEKNWNGQLDIQIGEGWVRAQLADGPSVRGSNFSFSRGHAEYMTIYPYAEDDYQAMGATLILEKITGQWQPIEGMTKLERWMYIDEDEFNPKFYLRDLKAALQ